MVDELADEGESRREELAGVLVEDVVVILGGRDSRGPITWVGDGVTDSGPFRHGLTQIIDQVIPDSQRALVLEHEPEATLGRWALGNQVQAAQLGAVGRDCARLGGRRRCHPGGAGCGPQ